MKSLARRLGLERVVRRNSAFFLNTGSLPDEHKVSKKSANNRSVTLHEHGAEEPSTVEDNVNGGVHPQDDVN